MNLVKSKQRVADHGEVFTPASMVEAMLDLVKDETERIDSRFLEPACGSGNFLVRILQRKLAAVDPRLPPPGQEVRRKWRGQSVVVKVRTNGFEYNGRVYKSLSAIAQEVTGTKWNGFMFFNLGNGGGKHAER